MAWFLERRVKIGFLRPSLFMFILFSAIFSGCFLNDYSTITKDSNNSSASQKIDKLLRLNKINDKDRQGLTLLAWAVFWNNESLVRKLLENNASVNIQLKDNHLWNIALNVRVIKQRETQDDKDSKILKEEIRYPNIEIIKLLIDHGLDVNEKLKDGNSPLHLASANVVLGANKEIIEILLKNGAKKDCLNDNNQTPIEYAKSIKEKILLNKKEFSALENIPFDENILKLDEMLK